MLLIPRNIYNEMIEHAESEYPFEACGILAGTLKMEVGENSETAETLKSSKNLRFAESMEIEILKKAVLHIPMENTEHSATHFSMKPKELLRIQKELRKQDYTILACYHSHPNAEAVLSEEDKRLAYDKKASHLILSLKNMEQPVLSAYQYVNGVLCEEKWKMIP